MSRKEITAFLIDCKPDEFLVYRDEAEAGTVVVGPDGKKFRFSNDQLDQAVIEIKRKAAAEKPVAKKKTSAKRKAAPRKKTKPAPKTA